MQTFENVPIVWKDIRRTYQQQNNAFNDGMTYLLEIQSGHCLSRLTQNRSHWEGVLREYNRSYKLHVIAWRMVCILMAHVYTIHAPSLYISRAPVAQWVVRPTHTQLVPGSKHAWCKKPTCVCYEASWAIDLAAQCLNRFPSSVQPNTLKGLAKFPYYQ